LSPLVLSERFITPLISLKIVALVFIQSKYSNKYCYTLNKTIGKSNMQEHEQSQTTPIPDSIEVSATLDSLIDPELDNLYAEAVKFVTESRIASVSAVQRRFKIGYNRSSNLLDVMEAEGIVSWSDPHGRVVLAPTPVLP
jgi:DNA segregation ATPase FtsK/SpoIIIE-like protein